MLGARLAIFQTRQRRFELNLLHSLSHCVSRFSFLFLFVLSLQQLQRRHSSFLVDKTIVSVLLQFQWIRCGSQRMLRNSPNVAGVAGDSFNSLSILFSIDFSALSAACQRSRDKWQIRFAKIGEWLSNSIGSRCNGLVHERFIYIQLNASGRNQLRVWDASVWQNSIFNRI